MEYTKIDAHTLRRVLHPVFGTDVTIELFELFLEDPKVSEAVETTLQAIAEATNGDLSDAETVRAWVEWITNGTPDVLV